jgi:hypothetical protein
MYVTSATELSLSAADAASGVAVTKYRVDGSGDFLDYSNPFCLSGDGVRTVEYYSEDNVGNTESVQTIVLLLDDVPPEINIEAPSDEEYVYDEVEIEITATDLSSGVVNVEYSLDDGSTWLTPVYDLSSETWKALWDTSTSDEGSLNILARGWDNLGNLGEDETPPKVAVMYLDYSIQFTDGDMNPLSSMDVIFSAQKPPFYKLNIDPGNICEVISVKNIGTTTVLPRLEINIILPEENSFLGKGDAFTFLGAKSAHIYLNGVDVTPGGRWLPDLASFDIALPLNPGDEFEIVLHYEYAFKGNRYSDPEVSAWLGADYEFGTSILTATGPEWSNMIRAYPILR